MKYNTKCSLCGKPIRLSNEELIHKNKKLSCSSKCQDMLRKKGIRTVSIYRVRQYRKRKEEENDIYTKLNSLHIK